MVPFKMVTPHHHHMRIRLERQRPRQSQRKMNEYGGIGY
jgi:hypothetical protein